MAGLDDRAQNLAQLKNRVRFILDGMNIPEDNIVYMGHLSSGVVVELILNACAWPHGGAVRARFKVGRQWQLSKTQAIIEQAVSQPDRYAVGV